MENSASDTETGAGTPERSRKTFSSDVVVESYSDDAVDAEIFPTEEKVFERYFTESGARVLDLGCGAGRTTRRLAEEGFDVTGIDISEEMVAEARTLFPDLDVRVGDAANLDFPDESFDYALFSYTGLDFLYPEAKRKRALAEIYRVLKPGGVFAYSSLNTLYLFPALVRDWSYLRNFYLRNGNLRQLFDRYKSTPEEYGMKKFMANPLTQRRQIRDAGFELVACVGKHEGPIRFFEIQPYYVSRRVGRAE